MSLRPFLLAMLLAPAAGLLPTVAAQEASPSAPPAPSASPSPAASPSPEPKWDVTQPPGPARTVEIDTDEGTWLSVDVSPDGRDVVFDLLGDIYTVPLAGGEARALSTGHAWDMQPRYSPSGKQIAFTSDRAGGDNIWVMDRDGSNPQAVTKETFRLLNSPTWSPDGEFIAARKHFTSTRSAGAGEIWLYHRSGGEGLEMTKRPNDQKDLGEPAFSPDGRYLYYSQDITPGAVFEYNKDPHGMIYAIQRLDRETGQVVRAVSGPGGSIRPTPSRDGRQLAFIRRVDAKTVLFVRDLESGRERPVYDGLDRDMQETWAIHGVYPGMSWTPDNRTVVFWSGGKLRRVDVGTGVSSVIPFRVKARHQLADALRFPVEVAPDRFRVRMLRWVQVSPAGDQVVYQALGKLWLRALPDGTPRRLTKQEDHSELYPSWSRDGRSIVYTTWDDEVLGAVRVADARTGASRVLTTQPGHFVEPAFTPDGAAVVFRRIGGDELRSQLWEGEPGVYVIPAAGGAARLVTREGRQPHFGAESDRVYLLRTQDEDKRALVSLELDGSDTREHVLSEAARDFRVSPDGRWLAFQERYQAFVAPFVRTGKRMDIGPKSKSLPVARVSRDAGDYLHWAGNSARLHWSLGPELFTRELAESFAFLAAPEGKVADPPARGRDISFDAPTDVAKGTVAVVGGRVVTMRGDEVIDDGVVVIRDGRIQAVGRRADVPVPAGAHVVDAAGGTVMPGLVDVHWHGSKGSAGIVPDTNWTDAASLTFGVTTIHDPSNDTATIFAASELARAGLVTAPRTFSTGTILYGAAGDFKVEVDSLDDARTHLRRMQAVGAFSVKSYNQPRRDQRQQIVTAARELGMMVVPEGGSALQHNLTMILDGHTGVEHSIPVANIYKDVRELWAASKVGYTPTLVVGYGGIWGENYWYHHTDVWNDARLRTFVPRSEFVGRSRRRVMAPLEDYNHFANARVAKELADAGVSVQLGAHGQREGLAAHWELWMFVQGGMTPHQALRAGTLDGARYLGLDKDLGSLEPGKLGDVLVVTGDVLADIRQSREVRTTIVSGRVFEAATMNEVWPRARPRGAFPWER